MLPGNELRKEGRELAVGKRFLAWGRDSSF